MMSFPTIFFTRLIGLILILLLPCTAVSTTVIFETTLGNFEVRLLDEETPATVANFLRYVADGDYDNSFIHRSVPDFVIQGGGFTFNEGQVTEVPTDPPVKNEFRRSNARGTIAMARLGGQPDSATSQWFINLADNARLDDIDGGFTVFGIVTGNGMDIVDGIAALQTWRFNSVLGPAFGELPLIDYPNNRKDDPAPRQEDLVIVNVRVKTDAETDK